MITERAWMNVVPHRRAVTLVELLAVVAIIGLLAALLLPAVQAARESSRRSTCSNNIRLIGLGLQQHHESQGSLPQLTYDPASGGGYWPWTIVVMPYMELSQFADMVRSGSPNSMPGTRKSAAESVIAPFICPSDRATVLGKGADLARGMNWPNACSSKLNYLGNAGPMIVSEHSLLSGYQDFSIRLSRGMFRKYNSGVGFGSVRDGLTNTFCVGESAGLNRLPFTQEQIPGVWAFTAYNFGGINEAVRYTCDKVNPGTGVGFSSFHPGGCALCDVRWLGEIHCRRNLLCAIVSPPPGWYGS